MSITNGEEESGEWGAAGAELYQQFAALIGAGAREGLEVELSGRLPWASVTTGQARAEVEAWREAEDVAGEWLSALHGAGMSTGELPVLSGGLSAQGEPLLCLSGVRLARAVRPVPAVGRQGGRAGPTRE